MLTDPGGAWRLRRCHNGCSNETTVDPILGGALGAIISAAVMLWKGSSQCATEMRDSALRLTIAVETVGERLSELHADFKADRVEIFGRLRDIENKVSSIEAKVYK